MQYALEVLQPEPAYLTDPHHPFVQILRKNAAQYRAVSGSTVIDQDLPLVANGAGSVGNVISRLGIPIINAYGCESGNVHAPNEWLNLKTIEPVFQTYWASCVCNTSYWTGRDFRVQQYPAVGSSLSQCRTTNS